MKMMRTFPENAGRLYVEFCPLRLGSDGERRLRLRFPPSSRCGRWGAMWVRVVAVAVRPCVASLVPPGNMASRWLFVQKAATNELMDCCSCWCSFCSAGGRDVMAYHLASLLHAVGAGAALTSSTVAFILSALGRWHLVCLPAVFSLLRASYACYQPAAQHSSSPHYHERIPRRAPLTFRVCFVGSGAKGASADDWRTHACSCSVTPVALQYPSP